MCTICVYIQACIPHRYILNTEYVCVCVCVCVYIYIYICIYIYIYIYTYTYIYIYIHIHACMFLAYSYVYFFYLTQVYISQHRTCVCCLYVSMLETYMRTLIQVPDICIYIHTYIHMYTYIHTYKYTHTYTRILGYVTYADMNICNTQHMWKMRMHVCARVCTSS